MFYSLVYISKLGLQLQVDVCKNNPEMFSKVFINLKGKLAKF
jgi:hypothetical protein